jgi:hypothetical protein
VSGSGPAFPVLRWVALLWLGVYLPSYALAYGWANFLFLCNLGVFILVAGLWTGSALLVSSQAIGVLVVDAVWTADLVSRLLTGRHFIGGTEYMWDPRWPLFTRLLSLYHAATPLPIVHALRRLGYDPRAYWLQSALAVVFVLVGRLLGAEANVNGAFLDPIFKRAWGPAPVHLAVVAGALVLVVYPLTHLALRRLFRPAPGTSSPALRRSA